MRSHIGKICFCAIAPEVVRKCELQIGITPLLAANTVAQMPVTLAEIRIIL
ncbi:hypothetical protein [Nostoc sp. CMAA1605]|uniref:hypothetical protein n=1 Tax=Nostoc sp. CMAA1605 TaxID=2055159 RepID=UPI001F167692|nr:hypothetical protein [Nostoc sp. CMAA1605]